MIEVTALHLSVLQSPSLLVIYYIFSPYIINSSFGMILPIYPSGGPITMEDIGMNKK